MKVRTDWSLGEVEALFALPFMDLLYEAQTVHRHFQIANSVQVSTLLSIKTGACPEDCAYCPQSVRYDTGLETEELMELEDVMRRASAAQPVFLNGEPGAAWMRAREVLVAFRFRIADDRIVAIELVAEPAVLGQLVVER